MFAQKATNLGKNKFIEETLKELNYHNEREAVIELTLLSASAKYAEFAEECQRLEKKYGISYEEFKKRAQHKKNEENFGEEDDLMGWKFAIEGSKFWFKKLKELKSAI